MLSTCLPNPARLDQALYGISPDQKSSNAHTAVMDIGHFVMFESLHPEDLVGLIMDVGGTSDPETMEQEIFENIVLKRQICLFRYCQRDLWGYWAIESRYQRYKPQVGALNHEDEINRAQAVEIELSDDSCIGEQLEDGGSSAGELTDTEVLKFCEDLIRCPRCERWEGFYMSYGI